MQAAAAAVGAHQDLLITGKAFDVEMQQIAWEGMFVTHDGRSGMQIAPAAEMDAAQDSTDGCGTESGGAGDLIAGRMLSAQFDDAVDQFGGCGAWTAQWARGTVAEPLGAQGVEATDPLGGGLGSHQKATCSGAEGVAGEYKLGQLLSTAKGKSGILVDVHSISLGKLDCSSQSASPVLIEWTTS